MAEKIVLFSVVVMLLNFFQFGENSLLLVLKLNKRNN